MTTFPVIDKDNLYSYAIDKIDSNLCIDGNWDKPPWNKIEPLHIANENNWLCSYKPKTKVKVCYNQQNLYVIFQVKDRYVKCVTNKHNGPVWRDSCVEFFFTPYLNGLHKYFNIEINCNGYANMAFHRVSKKDYDRFTIEEIEEFKIAHTIDVSDGEEINQPTEWIVEYKLPFYIITKYSGVPFPGRGDIWKANFYKCAENNSHPHWLSWAKINNEHPDFHLTQFMQMIKFV